MKCLIARKIGIKCFWPLRWTRGSLAHFLLYTKNIICHIKVVPVESAFVRLRGVSLFS